MPTASMKQTTLCGKPIQFVGTAAWNNMYGGLEAVLYIKTALELLQGYPYDMYVFEMPDPNHYQIKVAGYHLVNETLVEDLVIFQSESLKIEKFWMKIDLYPEGYIGTFLFPSEY